MRRTIFFLTITALLAADAPVLTPEQRLAVREAQLALSDNRAEIAETQDRLNNLLRQRPVLQAKFDQARAAVTPEGWNLQPDMTLVRCKWTEEPGCGKKKPEPGASK